MSVFWKEYYLVKESYFKVLYLTQETALIRLIIQLTVANSKMILLLKKKRFPNQLKNFADEIHYFLELFSVIKYFLVSIFTLY